MSSINRVTLMGRLGADPEVRNLQSGDKAVNLRLATSETWKDKTTGERKERTEWHRVVIFNEGLCRVAEQYLRKGSKVYLEGQLQTREWEDRDGQRRFTTEIVLQGFNSVLTMLDSRGQGGGMANGAADYGGGSDFGRSSPMEQRGQSSGGSSLGDEMDDEIPF